MKVFLGADHGGFTAKQNLKAGLLAEGYEIDDLGADQLNPDDDYPIFAEAVAKEVSHDPNSRGIVLCRSGHGMVIAANKVPGIRAILATDIKQTVQSLEHDNSNVLAFGPDYIDNSQILPISLSWLKAEFLGGNHARRLDQIADLERRVLDGDLK